jgi:hypothetical protein
MVCTRDGLESARARCMDLAGAGVDKRLLKPASWSRWHRRSVTTPTAGKAGKAVTLSCLANEGAAQEMRQPVSAYYFSPALAVVAGG